MDWELLDYLYNLMELDRDLIVTGKADDVAMIEDEIWKFKQITELLVKQDDQINRLVRLVTEQKKIIHALKTIKSRKEQAYDRGRTAGRTRRLQRPVSETLHLLRRAEQPETDL